jgi:hypothetical protein
MGFFVVDKTLEFMEQTGFKGKFLKNGLMKERGLYVGVKRPWHSGFP